LETNLQGPLSQTHPINNKIGPRAKVVLTVPYLSSNSKPYFCIV